MRRNVADLEALDELARRVGAERVLVSNILPYSAEMEKEMLCALTLTTESFAAAAAKTEVRLPRMDITPATRETILRLLRGYENLNLMGNPIFAETNHCRFVEGRTSFVRWDGAVAPCMGLLHGYKTFLYGYERHDQAARFRQHREENAGGDLALAGLPELPREGPRLRLLALPHLRRLQPAGNQRRGLPGQRLPGLRRLPLGPGRHPMPLDDGFRICSEKAVGIDNPWNTNRRNKS